MSFEKILNSTDTNETKPNAAPDKQSEQENGATASHEFLSSYSSKLFEHEGYSTHYIDAGESKNHRTVICMHSRYGWAFSFRKLIPRLVENGYRVVAIDLLGFGLSDKPGITTALSTYSQCCRVRALIQHLELKDLTIVAHEMSCRVATQLPYMLPKKIEALVFVNPGTPINDDGWSGLHMWRTLQNTKIDEDIVAEVRNAYPLLSVSDLHALCQPLLSPNGLDGLKHFHSNIILEAGDPDYIFIEHGYRWLRESWSGYISILTGSEDPLFDFNMAKKLCGQIGHKTKNISRLKCIDGLPFEERPGFIQQTVDEFYTVW